MTIVEKVFENFELLGTYRYSKFGSCTFLKKLIYALFTQFIKCRCPLNIHCYNVDNNIINE